MDAGNLRGSHSACAKAFGGDSAMKVTTDAVQVFGGYGYTQDFIVEKLMRDAKLLQIYEGTTQIQRLVIARDLMLLRMVPFVERNYNIVELGPRGTGKSHLFQQVSPYAHLISGGKATVARMFVNNQNGQRGLVCQYDVVCFDEISGVSFDQKDGVNIMKGYMESGEFSRGKESIRAEGGVVMVGNFDVDVQHQQRVDVNFGHTVSMPCGETRQRSNGPCRSGNVRPGPAAITDCP